jgi:phosphohistidine phosphatase
MGKYMAAQKLAPDLILCSTAVRTRQTLALVLRYLPRETKVEYEDGLYLAAATVILKRIRAAAPEISHLMVVGHDPGMHGLATKLAGSGDPDLMCALAAKFPTAGLAVMVFDKDRWKAIRPGKGRLKLFMSPKRLP